WSSDVCSSDLDYSHHRPFYGLVRIGLNDRVWPHHVLGLPRVPPDIKGFLFEDVFRGCFDRERLHYRPTLSDRGGTHFRVFIEIQAAAAFYKRSGFRGKLGRSHYLRVDARSVNQRLSKKRVSKSKY